MDNNQQPYDQTAAQDAGYMAGRAENDYNRAGQDVRQDAQAVERIPGDIGQGVEQGFDKTVQGVEDIPSDMGNAVKGAADWIGNQVGGAEGDVRRAGQDVQSFDNSVDQSYNQGEQQGRQQGGW